jgi:hypothetical protein
MSAWEHLRLLAEHRPNLPFTTDTCGRWGYGAAPGNARLPQGVSRPRTVR